MYRFSTKLDTEKQAYSGLARIISAEERAQNLSLIRPIRPIRGLFPGNKKNGTDAEPDGETYAERCAVVRADNYAEPCADDFAEVRADTLATKMVKEQNETSNFLIVSFWLRHCPFSYNAEKNAVELLKKLRRRELS